MKNWRIQNRGICINGYACEEGGDTRDWKIESGFRRKAAAE